MTLPRIPRTTRMFLKNPRFLMVTMGGTAAAIQLGEPIVAVAWVGAVVTFPIVYTYMWNRRRRASAALKAEQTNDVETSTTVPR